MGSVRIGPVDMLGAGLSADDAVIIGHQEQKRSNSFLLRAQAGWHIHTALGEQSIARGRVRVAGTLGVFSTDQGPYPGVELWQVKGLVR